MTYKLHPSFGDRATQSIFDTVVGIENGGRRLIEFPAIDNPPFRIQEQGWGEFDMQVILSAADKDHIITHDLNFATPRYESKHVVVCIYFLSIYQEREREREREREVLIDE